MSLRDAPVLTRISLPQTAQPKIFGDKMQKKLKFALLAGLVISAVSSWAAPVSLGSIEHKYGTDAGRVLPTISSIFHPGGNCDTANATSLTVKATSASTCNRFGDIFDFSGIDYASIDHFTVTLTFAGARDQVAGFERWNVRASYNYVQSGINFGSQLNASGTQTFDFPSSMSNFSNILGTENFMMAFATNSGSSSTFNLASAKLELFGTAAVAAVPEPGSIALLGLGLAALAVSRKRKQN
jgi:hypothetical protein